MNYWNQSKTNIYVAAHRGWRSAFPENTMSAFKAALELGVDQLETDVRISADSELVLIHDKTVDRTTNGKGLVREMTLEQLRALDAGSYKGEQFKGEKIPTLIEFMELVKNHPTITLDIELKEYTYDVGEELSHSVCDRVLKIIDDYGFSDRVVINTFDGMLHEYINEKYGDKYRLHVYYPIGNLKKVTRNPYDYAYCCCMFRAFYDKLNMATKSEFEIMASYGVQPWAGACVTDEKGVDRAIEAGATLITCDNPDVILDLLRKKGYHK